MAPALLLGRILLAVVLGVAGLSKLHSRDTARTALADFGVPAWLIAPLGMLLPVVELGIAALLLPAGSAWWGAAGALTLLLIFTAAIAANLLTGRSPRCNCFGQIHSQPVSGTMVVRNSALASFAGLMVGMGPGSQPGLAAVGLGPIAGALQLSPVVTMIILAVLLMLVAGSVALAQVFRQQGRLLLRIESLEQASAAANPVKDQGLPIGSPAPAFELGALSGGRLGLDDLLGEQRDVLLLFSNPQCGPCAALMPDVAAWQGNPNGPARIVVITGGPETLNRAIAEQHGLRDVLQDAGDVARRYRIDGTPSAVLIRRDRTIGSRSAFGRDAIWSLISSPGAAGDVVGGADKGRDMAA